MDAKSFQKQLRDEYAADIKWRTEALVDARQAKASHALIEMTTKLAALTDSVQLSVAPWSLSMYANVDNTEQYVELLRRVIATIEDAGYKHGISHQFAKEGNEPVYVRGFHREDGRIFSLIYNIRLTTGGSCKLVEIGKKVVEVPVFEVRCE